MRVFDSGELVAEIPVKALAVEAPVYTREERRPDYLDEVQKLDWSGIPEPKNFTDVLKRLLDSPSLASKEWVYRQYDHMVRTDTVFLPGHDAALLRIKGTPPVIMRRTFFFLHFGHSRTGFAVMGWNCSNG